jgi:uroporphyrinogen III methyltransferase / synthase
VVAFLFVGESLVAAQSAPTGSVVAIQRSLAETSWSYFNKGALTVVAGLDGLSHGSMNREMSEPTSVAAGRVYLVGAGPGDPALITLRGVQCLAQADVVLYDYLVNPRILSHAPASSERICLGEHGRTRIWPQREIDAKMVELALAGKTVVRLKGGDPAVFARGAEEVEVLHRHGIPYEVVPGITAALAAGSYAGVPITHRGLASAAALVTGQEIDGKDGAGIDYAALARFPGTLVVYMGVTTAPQWTSRLIEGGMPGDTPAIIIRRCSFPDQQTIRCRLDQLTRYLGERSSLRPPIIVILGPVAGLEPRLSWFETRPLFGRRVLVTRPEQQNEDLARRLEEQGAQVLVQPAIAVRPPDPWTDVDAALAELDRFDWLVFSSANGVHALLGRLDTLGYDLRRLGSVRLAAIGPATSAVLRHYHLRVDCQPARYQAEDLAAALAGEASGKRFLLARASRGRDVLARQLLAAGGDVRQIVVYESVDVKTPDPDIARQLSEATIDWTTVTSSAIARSLVTLFGPALHRTRLASISPITSETLRTLGFEPAVEARTATMQGIVDAICQR